jgi:hypothetical protein
MPQIRVTSRSGSIPTVSQLSLGDIAVNIYDGRAFLKKQVGATQTIVEIGGSSISSSYALSSSYAANGGVIQLIAGTNITLSPADGKGVVTINASAGGGGSGVPNGPNYSLQYNNGGNFSGSGNFTLLNNNALYLTGSFNVSGSTFFTGSVSSLNGFTGSLFGTSSWALSASQVTSASYALSSSYALSASFAVSSSRAVSSSFAISSSRAVSSSYALSASYAPDTTFPYTGSAIISGSLEVIGNLTVNTPSGDIDLTSTNIILNAGTLRAPLLPSSTPLPGAVLNTVLIDTLNGTLYVTSSLPGSGGGGGGTTPGGATNTIQFNNAGAFSGSGNFTLVGGNTVLLTGSLNTSGSLNITGSINVRGQVLVTGSITATGSLNSNGANALNLGSNNFSVKTITLGQIETLLAVGTAENRFDTNTITLNRNLNEADTSTHTQINFDGRYWEYFPGPELYDAYADTGNHYLKFTSGQFTTGNIVYNRFINLQFHTKPTGSNIAKGFSTNYNGSTYFNVTGSVSASSYYGDGSNLNNLYTTPVLFNAQTSNYSASLSDLGKMVELTGSSPISIYIPPNSVTAFPTGSQITFIQTGTQVTTFVTGSGVTLNSYNNLKTLTGRYSVATCVKKSADTWYLFGDLS